MPLPPRYVKGMTNLPGCRVLLEAVVDSWLAHATPSRAVCGSSLGRGHYVVVVFFFSGKTGQEDNFEVQLSSDPVHVSFEFAPSPP